MWTMLVIVYVTVIFQLVFSEEFIVYTHEAIRDDNGKPCLTGCSPFTNECVTEARGTYREKRKCRSLDEPAPIYLTAQKQDPGRKHCLSNCGFFNMFFNHEWCFTADDFATWDYCSSNTHRNVLPTGQLQSVTTNKKTCTDECAKSRNMPYFWCHYGLQVWDTCALPALPRIPVLDHNYHAGQKNKGKCDDFFRYNSEFEQSPYSTSVEVRDNYVVDIAEAIEAVGSNILSQIVNLHEYGNPIESYTMVKIQDVMVPAIIRAHITESSTNLITNSTGTSSTILKKVRQQMFHIRENYDIGTLIGFELGGPNAEYNLVPRPLSWKCEDWADMEEAIINWTRKTGGSVDMLIVVLYRNAKTPIPKAFGVSQTFRNADHSVFVDCREKIFWNNI